MLIDGPGRRRESKEDHVFNVGVNAGGEYIDDNLFYLHLKLLIPASLPNIAGKGIVKQCANDKSSFAMALPLDPAVQV